MPRMTWNKNGIWRVMQTMSMLGKNCMRNIITVYPNSFFVQILGKDESFFPIDLFTGMLGLDATLVKMTLICWWFWLLAVS